MLEWLLNSDPSVKWKVQKELLNLEPEDYQKTRDQISEIGWGKDLLSYQDLDTYMWAGGIYGPKWKSTTYTMLSLKRMGLNPDNPQAINACKLFLSKGHYTDGGINFFKSMSVSELCVTGLILQIITHFNLEDDRIHTIPRFLIDNQRDDGGWNCDEYRYEVKHSSFHTSINVMEGLLEYTKKYSNYQTDIKESLSKAVEFILEHEVYKSSTTKEIFDKKMTMMSYPHRWKFDAFRFLEFLIDFDFGYDERIEDAIKLLHKKRTKDGYWKMQGKYTGKVFFDFEPCGKISKINTYRGLRILKWYEAVKNKK